LADTEVPVFGFAVAWDSGQSADANTFSLHGTFSSQSMSSMVLQRAPNAVGLLILECRGCHCLMMIFFMLGFLTLLWGNVHLGRIPIHSTTFLKGGDQEPNGRKFLKKFSQNSECVPKIIPLTPSSTTTLAHVQIRNRVPNKRGLTIKGRHHHHPGVIH